MTALEQITKELQELGSKPLEDWSIESNRNVFQWKATTMGLYDTPYAGGVFFLEITFPSNYPSSPPKILFTSKIYHPNINSSGSIQLKSLGVDWMPTFTMREILAQISDLLRKPCLDEALQPDIAQLYKHDKSRFETTAREWVRRYGM